MGFAPTVARLVLLTAIMKGTQPLMYAGGSHVSPRGIIKLDRDGVNPHAPPQSATGARACPVELWHRHDPIVWTPHRSHLSRAAVGAEGRDRRTALLCMVLRGVPEDGCQTSRAGGHHVFC